MQTSGRQHRLKVLHIADWYPSAANQAAGVFVKEHVKATALYNDVIVLHRERVHPAVRGVYQVQDRVEDGLRTLRLWYRKTPNPLTSYAICVYTMLAVVRSLVREGFRPHVVHAHVHPAGFPALLIGRWLRCPVVVTEHSSAFPRGLIRGLEKLRARIVFEHCGMVCPVSEALRRAIQSYGIRGRFQVVPNVVDTSLFYPHQERPTADEPKQLLFVGALDSSHKKGVPFLLQALAQLQEEIQGWELSIVGDGPAREEYERMTARYGLGDKVVFHGMKSKASVAALMREAALLVVPSIVETFSVVAAEALATGTPVLATRCGGPEEFITEEVGVLVPPANADALRHGLERILSNISHYSPEYIAEYARTRFAPEAVGATLRELYAKLLESNQKSI